MASLILRQAVRLTTAVRAPLVSLSGAARSYSSAADVPPPAAREPPFTSTLRADFNTATRDQDENRVAVLHTLITETVQSQQSPLPILTDKHLLRLMRRTRLQSADTATDHMMANRQDLAENVLKQMAIIRKYEAATGIKTLSRDQVAVIVDKVVSQHPDAKIGEIMRRIDETLQGQDALKSDIVLLVNAAVKTRGR